MAALTDILYLAHNRLEFTKASLAALVDNTNWAQINRLLIYDDNSVDGTREYLAEAKYPMTPEFHFGTYKSPVAVMNDYICSHDARENRHFAKIDSDTMVPPGWLDECRTVLARYPQLALLGIEAFCDVDGGRGVSRGFRKARHIGGIGLMQSAAFTTLPRPSGRFGFTHWQEREIGIDIGWIDPSIPVFLLDRMPREPWISLSKEYVSKGWQRDWGKYTEECKPLWSWWCE